MQEKVSFLSYAKLLKLTSLCSSHNNFFFGLSKQKLLLTIIFKNKTPFLVQFHQFYEIWLEKYSNGKTYVEFPKQNNQYALLLTFEPDCYFLNIC